MRWKLCFVTAVLGLLTVAYAPSKAQAQAIYRGMPNGLGAWGDRWLFEPPYNGGANRNQTPPPGAYDVYEPFNPYLWEEYYPAHRPYRYRYRYYGPTVYDRGTGYGSRVYNWW